jgi:hypothetical protein
MSVRRSQFAIRLYVAACVLVAIVFVAVAIHTFPLDREAAIGFGLLSFIVAQFPLTLPTGALYDITFLITIAAIIAGGPGVAAIATVCSTISLPTARSAG